MFDLASRDIKYLSGVGPQRASVLNKELNIYSLHDLLYYFPYKYVDRSRIYYIHEIDGTMPYIQLKGEILGFETVGEGRQRRLIAHFSDGTGIVDLVWFQGIKFLVGKYKVHQEYIVFGKPSVFNGRINIAHPDIDNASELKLSTMGLQPYYNTTEKMKRSSLNSHAIEKMMSAVVQQLREPLPETLSPAILTEHHLMPLTEALMNIHFPANPELLRKAQYRLKFEELFYVQLNILRYAKDRQRKYRGYVFETVGEIFNTFYAKNLPFELTGAQKRVLKEIRRDVGSGKQMNRLLQGDVGSGKTLVALMSMLIALDNGYQACMMAPTEILANQHFETIRELLYGMDIRVELLTGSVKGKKRDIKFIIFLMLLIHLLQKTYCLLQIHITDIHNVLHTNLERSTDKQTDMRNMIILKNRICATSHDHAVFTLCQFTDQITHIEKYCVLLRKSMITIEFPEPGFQICVFFLSVFIKSFKITSITDCIFVCLQTLHNLIKNFCIIIVDLKLIRQFKSDIITATSLCTADTDDQMIIFGNLILASCDQIIQTDTFFIYNICLSKCIRKTFNLFQNTVILYHKTSSLALIPDGTGHVTDQRQFTSEQMSVRLGIHQCCQMTESCFFLSCKCTSQRGTHTFINFFVQVINAYCKFFTFFLIILHNDPPSL